VWLISLENMLVIMHALGMASKANVGLGLLGVLLAGEGGREITGGHGGSHGRTGL